MTLSSLLGKFSINDIKSACGSDWSLIQQTIPVNQKLDDKQNVIDVVLRLYGTSILEITDFRELFLRTLPESDLFDLANILKIKIDDKTSILIARLLASKPWGPSSKLLRTFKNIGFDESFLPFSKAKYKTTESIDVFEKPPELFEYQKEVMYELVKSIEKSADRVLVQLPTGSGKTRIMMEAIQKLASKNKSAYTVLWLAHSEELLEQAISTFKKVWSAKGTYSATIHRLYSHHNPNDLLFSNSIIFAGLQKISRLDLNDDLFKEIKKNVSLVVVDEAHKSLAETYERSISQLIDNNNAKLVGVTATPGRSYELSSENRNFAKFFNDNLITPDLGDDPIKTLQEMQILATVKRKVIGTDVDIPDIEINAKTLKKLGRIKERNNLLFDEIEHHANENRPTLVFSCSVEHSRLLATGLAQRGISAAYVDYTKSSASRRADIERFQRGDISVLINFGVLSTGFDAPEIQTLVIARPTTSLILYSQMIGRGLRGLRVGGNKEVIVVDVKDNFSAYGDLDAMYGHFSGYWKN
jgi:DNA repair protein RadD